MIIIGIGARRGITSKEVIYAINKALHEIDMELDDVKYLASAKIKEHEAGLLEAAQLLDIDIEFLPHDVLNKFDVPSDSQAKRFGLKGVAEPSALALSNDKELILKKKIYGRITIAIAK